MTNEEIYENVMGHKPNKEFGIKGSFSWDDIDALMNAVKNCSIPAVVWRSEQLSCGRNITTCVFYKDGSKCSNLEYCKDQTT